MNTETLAREYYEVAFPKRDFIPGVTQIPVSGEVFDYRELQALIEASFKMWLTAGPYAREFEKEFARFYGLSHASLVNSGSSANLLALTSLELKPGDEVITAAASFPTTVNPIVQNRLTPVFIDIEIPTYNVDVSQLEEAYSPWTRAVMLAHALGNPFDVAEVTAFCKKHNLWLIEDCCDAVGSTYNDEYVGTFGDLATVSFFPAHHITMGEGGCVLTNSKKLKTLVDSYRDWGRDCHCEPGKDNSCGRRFNWKFPDLPYGYDHKYVYSHIGYNLRVTDPQAAVGLAQLEKLPSFIEARRRNFHALYDAVMDLEEYLILPKATGNPSWFGFPLGVRSGISRVRLIDHLEKDKISTRPLFGGNLARQPAYQNVRYRTVGDLPNSDYAMESVFWLGVYPGITNEMIDFVSDSLHRFFKCAI